MMWWDFFRTGGGDRKWGLKDMIILFVIMYFFYSEKGIKEIVLRNNSC